VRECFKGDEESQLLGKSSILACVMDGTQHAKFSSDRFRGFCSPNTLFYVHFDVTSFFLHFWGSSVRVQPTPSNGFLCKICKITSFQVRKCILVVPMSIF